MATKAVNLRMEEADILNIKEIASIFKISVTDLIKKAVEEYTTELKKDPYYRLTASVKEASAEETDEIIAEIENLSDDDLTIVSPKRITV